VCVCVCRRAAVFSGVLSTSGGGGFASVRGAEALQSAAASSSDGLLVTLQVPPSPSLTVSERDGRQRCEGAQEVHTGALSVCRQLPSAFLCERRWELGRARAK